MSNAPATSLRASPSRRAWLRFRSNRLAFASLVLLGALAFISLFAELISNDKPLIARYEGKLYFPVVQTLPETTFGGDFETPTDYHDPFIRKQLARGDNFAVFPLNPYHHQTINYFSKEPNPAPPSADNLLGTDDRGRDLFARLLYGFRISMIFAVVVASLCTMIGVFYGAIQGFFAGWTDIAMERIREIWSSMPQLYMLIIFSALFSRSFGLLIVLLVAFEWLYIASYVRAEFLRNRALDYVRAARALGQSRRQIMFRHILPNSLTPVITLVPFMMVGTIGALTSLGELLAQGKANLDAWWISLSTFVVLVGMLLLLVLIGDALRDALDPRKQLEGVA